MHLPSESQLVHPGYVDRAVDEQQVSPHLEAHSLDDEQAACATFLI